MLFCLKFKQCLGSVRKLQLLEWKLCCAISLMNCNGR